MVFYLFASNDSFFHCSKIYFSSLKEYFDDYEINWAINENKSLSLHLISEFFDALISNAFSFALYMMAIMIFYL